MDEAVLRNEIDNAMFLRYLHGNREVVGGLGREVDIDSLLDKGWVGGRVVDLHNMEL